MPDTGSHKPKGRNLPSWMSARDTDKTSDNKQPENEKNKPRESSIRANKSPKLMV